MRPVLQIARDHPLPFVILGAVVITAVLGWLVTPSEEADQPASGPAASPASGETPATVEDSRDAVAAAAPDQEPEGPQRAFDDFRYGIHLRYPLDWEDRAPGDPPGGPPGGTLLRVGPAGKTSALQLIYVGVLVPRAGIEALARRTAEMGELEVTTAEWIAFARKRSFRVLARGADRWEELTFFSHRRVLFCLRIVAAGDDAGALGALRAVGDGLGLD